MYTDDSDADIHDGANDFFDRLGHDPVGDNGDVDRWRLAEEQGWTRIGIPHGDGGRDDGSGETGGLVDGLGVVALAARHRSGVPVGATLWAGTLATWCGAELPAALATAAATSMLPWSDGRVAGTARAVPLGHRAELVAILATGPDGQARGMLLDPRRCEVAPTTSLSPHREVDLVVDQAPGQLLDRPVDAGRLADLAALCATARLVGTLEAVLDLTVRYVAERTQFGRPVGRFQAVQQHVVAIAHAAQLSSLSLWNAVHQWQRDPVGARPLVAAAYADALELSRTATRSAHQAHGAIGMTQEYPLHYLTKSLHALCLDDALDRARSFEQVGRAVVAAGSASGFALGGSR